MFSRHRLTAVSFVKRMCNNYEMRVISHKITIVYFFDSKPVKRFPWV